MNITETYSPFTLFADVCIADPPNALKLKELVDDYIENPDPSIGKELQRMFEEWKNNDEKFKSLAEKSPVNKEMLPMSENLIQNWTGWFEVPE